MTASTVLFAPGAGGDPARYAAIVEAVRAAGYHVIAPVSERFDPLTVTVPELRERVDVLRLPLPRARTTGLPCLSWGIRSVAGLGRALSGRGAAVGERRASDRGAGRTEGAPTRVARAERGVVRCAWCAGPPGALDRVSAPIAVHVGAQDTVTPPETASILRAAPTEVSIVEYPAVGHFDVMSTLPPGVAPSPGHDHEDFLRHIASAVVADLAAALGH